MLKYYLYLETSKRSLLEHADALSFNSYLGFHTHICLDLPGQIIGAAFNLCLSAKWKVIRRHQHSFCRGEADIQARRLLKAQQGWRLEWWLSTKDTATGGSRERLCSQSSSSYWERLQRRFQCWGKSPGMGQANKRLCFVCRGLEIAEMAQGRRTIPVPAKCRRLSAHKAA